MNALVKKIQKDVAQRARLIESEQQIGDVIFESVVAADIDWKKVSLEDVKQLIVIALKSYRQRALVPQVDVAVSVASVAVA